MAAPKCTPRDSDSSDEDLERFREAAWEPAGSKPIQIHEETNPPAAPSLRVQADCHEHDGNELQTTPEFRSHIAKKLSAILDSSIKVVTGSGIHQTENETTSDTQDSGFRLFYTSIPGDTGQVKDTAIPRCKVASSSDDSEEEEQRCREAAVSGADIIMNGALKTTSMESTNKHCDSPQKKKKRKKKKKEVKDVESDTFYMESETSITSVKKKRNKHKVEEDTLPTESNGLGAKKEDSAEGDIQITSGNGLCVKRKKKKKQKVD
uniref:Protein CUSTOS n=1 Tax=Leptobrachium leishanense TaxID=445787 RepID=A0A8C5M3N6_9ANUR